MSNRLERLRFEVDKLIAEFQPHNARYFFNHLYGVSEYCALLALRRGLDPELAAASGMLHDIYQVTAGSIEQHAVLGAEVAEGVLLATGLYEKDEIAVITTAISRHSKKRKLHDPYDEVLKDADVMSHCFYNTGFPPVEKEVLRYGRILEELGCDGG